MTLWWVFQTHPLSFRWYLSSDCGFNLSRWIWKLLCVGWTSDKILLPLNLSEWWLQLRAYKTLYRFVRMTACGNLFLNFFHHKMFLSPVLWQLNGSNLALALHKQLLEWLTQPWEERVRTVFADSDLSNLLGATNWGAHKQCRPVAEYASETWLADTGLWLQFPHRHKQWQYKFPAFGLLTGASNMCVGRGKPLLCSAGPRLSKPSTDLWSFHFTLVQQPVYNNSE